MTQNKSSKVAQVQLLTVTPAQAAEWLRDKAEWQRSTSSRRVEQLAKKMRKGDWKLTPTAAIGISKDGKVVDGQHRLQAVVSSGISLQMWVVKGADPSSFDVLDRGQNRSLSQIAKMAGCETHSTWHISAAHSLLWSIDSISSVNNRWDEQDITAVLNHYADELSIVLPSGGSRVLRGAHYRGAALRAVISRPDRAQEIADFIECFASGEPPNYNEAEKYKMAMRLRAAVSARVTGTTLNDRHNYWAATLNAIRHYLAGTEIVHKSNVLNYSHKIKTQPFPIDLDKKSQNQTFRSWLLRRAVAA